MWNDDDKYLKQIANDVHAIREILEKQGDVAGFVVSNSPPTKQGENEMANVKSLGVSASQAMLDDEHNTMSLQPVNTAGATTSLDPGQPVPAYTAAPGTGVTLVAAADGLSCDVRGVHGQAGTEVVTASYTNKDGTVATATDTYTVTVDPTELDVAGFNVTNSAPVKQ